jgi:hypothetical protein
MSFQFMNLIEIFVDFSIFANVNFTLKFIVFGFDFHL